MINVLLFSGITFTNKQIKMNERIHMKIIDIDQTGQWLGSLAIGNEIHDGIYEIIKSSF
jgi:hypothetical protein